MEVEEFAQEAARRAREAEQEGASEAERVAAENAAKRAMIEASLEKEAQERAAKTAALTRGAQALNAWAAGTVTEETALAKTFLQELDNVQGEVTGMLLDVERGSAEERRLLEAKAAMTEKLLGTTLAGASDATKREVRAMQQRLDKEMLEAKEDRFRPHLFSGRVARLMRFLAGAASSVQTVLGSVLGCYTLSIDTRKRVVGH